MEHPRKMINFLIIFHFAQNLGRYCIISPHKIPLTLFIRTILTHTISHITFTNNIKLESFDNILNNHIFAF